MALMKISRKRLTVDWRLQAGALALWLILVCLLPVASSANSQGGAKPSEQSVLPPPKTGLIAVPLPDLETLEAEIREQLVTLQTSLAAVAKDPAATAQQLGDAYGLLGQAYQAYALLVPAEACYRNAHHLLPKEFSWAYLLGIICQQTDRAADAIAYYQLARRLRPDYVAALVHLGNLYLERHQLDEARAAFKEALTLDGKTAAAAYGLGQAALSARQYADAARYFEQALGLLPEANRIHYALALAYRGLGNLEKAEAHFARQGAVGARVADPLVERLEELRQGERLHLLRGRVAFAARRYGEAAEAFQKAVAANPASVTARVNFGSALAQTGDFDAAIAEFTEALRLDAQNTAAHYNLGALLAHRNQPQAAAVHLRVVRDANPEDWQARYLLAQQLLRSARPQERDEAAKELAYLVEANPDDENALLDYAKLLWETKQYGEALARLSQSQARFPQRGQTAITLAYLLATCPQLERRDGATALQLARLAYQATGAVAHGVVIGLALAELGRCGEAAEWQRRMIAAAERDKNTELAHKLKADLQRYENASACRPPADATAAVEQPKPSGGIKKP